MYRCDWIALRADYLASKFDDEGLPKLNVRSGHRTIRLLMKGPSAHVEEHDETGALAEVSSNFIPFCLFYLALSTLHLTQVCDRSYEDLL